MEATENDRLVASQIAGGHRIRNEAAWFRRADGGGEEEVVSEAALPAESGCAQPFDEEGSSGPERVQAGERVGMAGMIRDQLRHARLGLLHRVRGRQVGISK